MSSGRLTGTYWLAALAGVLTTGASRTGASVQLAALPAALSARFAALLVPAVPLGPAELLNTPLLAESIAPGFPLSVRLHPEATATSAAIET
jgi:hypothetical protein